MLLSRKSTRSLMLTERIDRGREYTTQMPRNLFVGERGQDRAFDPTQRACNEILFEHSSKTYDWFPYTYIYHPWASDRPFHHRGFCLDFPQCVSQAWTSLMQGPMNTDSVVATVVAGEMEQWWTIAMHVKVLWCNLFFWCSLAFT